MWDNLVPGPHFEKSAVYNGADLTMPVVFNAVDVLTTYKNTEWLSIELV